MAVLSFKVQADYEKVVKLREEIAKLETQLKGVGKNTPDAEIKQLENKLSEAKGEFASLTAEAAKAGTAINKDFANKIRESIKTVDTFTEKIIAQKDKIRKAESEVKRLSEAYRLAQKGGGDSSQLKSEYDEAKKALEKERDAMFNLTQEKAKAALATKKLKDEYAEFKKEAGESKEANEGFQLSLGKVAGIIGGVTALKQLASQVVAVRAQFQDMETQIETLVGKDVTAKIMPQIKEMAKVSPLTMGDIVGAEKMMLSFNIEAEKSIDFLKALSDVSMGNSQKFNSLTLAFSQMSSAGKLMGQDLLQMINAGFNPLQQISAKTGKSISQLKEEMSKGAISAEMVQQAFLDATAAGGKFYNMSENASKTINGQISMMQDAMDAMFNEIGTKTEGIIIKSIQTVTSLIQNYEKVGKVLVGLVATYGTYRTAVMLSTVATGKHTLAEIALTNVRIAARKAQLALNAAMLTNPYVALATVVAGLTAAIVLNADAMSANSRAHKEYNEELEAANKLEEDRRNKVKENLDIVRDDAKATGERITALEELRKKYSSVFKQYDLEKVKLMDIAALKKEIAELDRQADIQSKKDRLAKLDEEVEKAAARANVHGGGLLGKLASSANKEGYEKLVSDRDALREEIIGDAITEYIAKLPEEEKKLKDLKDAIQQKLDSSEEFVLDGYALSKEHIEKINKAITEKLSVPKYSVDYNNAKKEWETAKKELDKIEKDKDKYTTKQYDEAKKRKETAEANFKKLGGDTTGKKEKDAVKKYNEQLAQQEKLQQAERKATKERTREAKDSEFMVEQARIDGMKEGVAKRRAQQKLDNEKEIENLERQKQDYIEKVVAREKEVFEAQEEQRAKNSEAYKKKAFDSEKSRASVDTKAYDDALAYTRAKQINQEGDFAKNLYNQYKSYEDKKKDLEKEYLDDILTLNTEFVSTGDEAYIRSINERHKAYERAQNKLESEYGTEEYKLIFGDPQKMTSATIEKALEAARKKMSELDKAADPESFKALSEAIERLEDARDNNPFQGWDTSVMGLVQKLYQIRNLRKDIAKYEKEGNKEAKEAAESQLEKLKKDLTKALIGTGVSQFSNALSTAAASMKEVAKASGDIDLEKQAEAMEKAAGFVSSVASGAASGGWIGAIIGGATSLMDMLISSITESKAVAAEAKKTYEDYLDEIAHTARSIKDEDYDTIFGVRSLEKVVAASGKAKVAWDDYLQYLEAKGTTYSYKAGKTNVTRWQDSLANMLVLEGEKTPNKNAKTLQNLPTLAEKFEGLFDEKGNLNLQKAKDVLDAYSKYSNEKWYEALSDAARALEDYEKNVKIVDDYLGSLFQNTGSDIVDAIMQGKDALEVLEQTAGDIFASIAKQMLIETLLSQDFIGGYKERLREAMATQGMEDDAEVLEDFVDNLGQRIGDAQDKWAEIQRIAEERGIDLSGVTGAGSQQEASRKGYQTLSEDTGNELVGRALAQYESNLRMEASVRETTAIAEGMAAAQLQIRDIAAESRALIADSYLELQQIRENTGNSAKMLKAIDARMTEWDSKIKSL